MKTSKTTACDKVTFGQKLSYGVGECGTSLIYGAIAYFLMVYFTDVAMIGGFAAGIIILIGRITDAVTDPIMGMIADRTRSRWGRFRPYLLFFSVPFAVSAVLLFSVPDWPMTWKIVYAIATYVLTGIFYTIVDIPYWSMLSAISKNPDERSGLSAVKRFFNMFNNFIVTILFLPLVAALGKGNDARGYQLVMIIFGVIGVCALLLTFFKTKERVVVRKQKMNFKATLKTVVTNKPLLLVLATALFLSATFNMRMGATIYYLTNNVGNVDIIPAFMGLAVLGVLAGIIISAPIAKAIGKRNACLIGILISSLCYLGLYITGTQNMPMMFVWNILGALALGVPLVVYLGMIADSVDYAEWRTGVRSDSFIFAMNTLVYKLTVAVGVAAVGIILSAVGYVPNVAQTERCLNGINLMMTIIPFAGGVLAIIPMFFYKLDNKRLAEINAELDTRRKVELSA